MSKHYYNNGVIEKVISEGCTIPEDFIPGRLPGVGKRITKSKNKSIYNWYTNSINNLYIKEGDFIPEGYVLGRSVEWYDKMLENNPKLNWYTNGEDNIMLSTLDPIPLGYKIGRCNIGYFSKSNINTKYYNDGEHDIRVSKNEIPNGLSEGRISNKNISTWCKGLTKDTDIRVLKRGKSLSNTFKEKNISDKIYKNRKARGNLNTSSIELKVKSILESKFEVNPQYKEDIRYPFACDFYIPSLDLFIELNDHWTHGPHPFDPNNEEDIKILHQWEEKAQKSEFYKVAIDVWTVKDPYKQEIARKNKLNYIMFYEIEKGSTTIESKIFEEISKYLKRVE